MAITNLSTVGSHKLITMDSIDVFAFYVYGILFPALVLFHKAHCGEEITTVTLRPLDPYTRR